MQQPARPTWDVMILNFDGHPPRPLASFRPGRGSRPMGPAAAVRGAIDGALADVEWSAPGRGILDDEGAPRLEFDLGNDGVLDGFVIHVRGERGAAALIAHLCQVNGWAALDVARGSFLDLEEPDRWRHG